jgi:hypothetical protein
MSLLQNILIGLSVDLRLYVNCAGRIMVHLNITNKITIQQKSTYVRSGVVQLLESSQILQNDRFFLIIFLIHQCIRRRLHGHTSVKFNTGSFHENLSRKSRLV